MKQYREKRACTECGYTRLVLVREWLHPDGKMDQMYSKLCTACEYLQAAAVHDAGARRARRKANEILERRKVK